MDKIPAFVSHQGTQIFTESLIDFLRMRNPLLFKANEVGILSRETKDKMLSSPLPRVINTTDASYIRENVEYYLNEDLKKAQLHLIPGVFHAILAGNFQRLDGLSDQLKSICAKENVSPRDITVKDAIILITNFYIAEIVIEEEEEEGEESTSKEAD